MPASLRRFFSAHPSSVGETYAEHATIALRFGGTMLVGGVACMLHAILPGIFQRSASRRVRQLHRELTERERAFTARRDLESDPAWQLEYEI